jgi:hypothetical protein
MTFVMPTCPYMQCMQYQIFIYVYKLFMTKKFEIKRATEMSHYER